MLMSEAAILSCLYDTRPPVNSGQRKQRQSAYKTCCPPHIQVFMGIKTTGFKSELKRDWRLFRGAILCPVLHYCFWWVHLASLTVDCVKSVERQMCTCILIHFVCIIFTQEVCIWWLSCSWEVERNVLICSLLPQRLLRFRRQWFPLVM